MKNFPRINTKKIAEVRLKKLLTILDYVFLLRPTLCYPVWIFFIAGHWGARQAFPDSEWQVVDALLIVSAVTLLMGAVYILNQLQDVETDRANHKLFIIADGIVSVRSAYTEAVILSLVSLAAGFMFHPYIGVLFVLLFIITGIFYNYPPTRWKDRPLMGMVANGMGCVLIYLIGWLAVRSQLRIPAHAWLYGVAGISVSLNTTLPDMEGDRLAGKRTFAVAYGIEATAIAALVVEALTIGWAWYLKEWLLFWPAVLVLPLFVWAVITRKRADVMRATKVSVVALALAVCVICPWVLIPVFAVFFLSKFYYRKRFDFNYPTFKSNEGANG